MPNFWHGHVSELHRRFHRLMRCWSFSRSSVLCGIHNTLRIEFLWHFDNRLIHAGRLFQFRSKFQLYRVSRSLIQPLTVLSLISNWFANTRKMRLNQVTDWVSGGFPWRNDPVPMVLAIDLCHPHPHFISDASYLSSTKLSQRPARTNQPKWHSPGSNLLKDQELWN